LSSNKGIFNEKKVPFSQVKSNRPERNLFIADLSRGVGGDLSDELEALSVSTSESKSGFRAYTRADAVAAMEKALGEQQQLSSGAVMDLSVSPGQEMFVKQRGAGSVPYLAVRSGQVTQELLENKKLLPYFNSTPSIGFKASLVRRLKQLGYKLMNSDDLPDSFTIVHLLAGPEKLFASVKLAVDGDLQPVAANADPRMSEAKSAAVTRILAATTLGEVFPGPGSLKIAFRDLSLQEVHLTN
jgi:hypothetical protein